MSKIIATLTRKNAATDGSVLDDFFYLLNLNGNLPLAFNDYNSTFEYHTSNDKNYSEIHSTYNLPGEFNEWISSEVMQATLNLDNAALDLIKDYIEITRYVNWNIGNMVGLNSIDEFVSMLD